jgi:predicted aspartyl protease
MLTRQSGTHGAYLRIVINGVFAECLVDTGSETSILPSKYAERIGMAAARCQVLAVNGNPITIRGEAEVPVDISGFRSKVTAIVSDDVAEPILGYDWLAANKVCINLGANVIQIDGRWLPLVTKQASKVSNTSEKHCRGGGAERDVTRRCRSTLIGGPADGDQVCLGLSHHEIVSAQNADPDIAAIRKMMAEFGCKPEWEGATLKTETVKALWTQWSRLAIKYGILCRSFESNDGGVIKWQVVLPKSTRERGIRMTHTRATGSHIGRRRTEAEVSHEAYWPGWKSDIARVLRNCRACMQPHVHASEDNGGGQLRDDCASGQIDQSQSIRRPMRTDSEVAAEKEHVARRVESAAAGFEVGDSVWWCRRLFDRRMMR